MSITGNDQERATGEGQLEDLVIFGIDTITHPDGRFDNLTTRGRDDSEEDTDVLLGSLDRPAEAVGIREYAKHVNNDVRTEPERELWASLTMPTQSAAGWRLVGGGLGQDQKMVFPATTAEIRTLMSKTTGRREPSVVLTVFG